MKRTAKTALLSLWLLRVRYRKRYWNEAYFGAVKHIQDSLRQAYGAHPDGSTTVSLVEAAMRWLKYHSMLSAEQGGINYTVGNDHMNVTISTLAVVDGIILGTTSMKQTEEDLDACVGGPLDGGIQHDQMLDFELRRVDCVCRCSECFR